MKIPFAWLLALTILNAFSATVPRDPDRTEVIAAFHEKYGKPELIAELEAIKDPTQRFLRIAAVSVELEYLQRAMGECAWNFVFYDSAGIPQPGGLTAEMISDPGERKRFVEEQANWERNLVCCNEIATLQNKLSGMLSIIRLEERSNDGLKEAYLKLQIALDQSRGSFLDTLKVRKAQK
jgi:hypothetical protein